MAVDGSLYHTEIVNEHGLVGQSAPILKFGTKIIRFCVIMIKIRIGVFL